MVRPVLALLVATALFGAAGELRAEEETWSRVAFPRDPALAPVLPTLPGLLVEGGTPDRLHADATAEGIAALRALGVSVDVLAADLQSLRPAPSGARGGRYHLPEEVTALLFDLAEQHPDFARVVDLGRSVEGRALTGLLLTDHPDRREPEEPALRVLGTHHGDEWSSMEVPLALAQSLLTARPDDAAVRALLEQTELWFLPVVNPDGVVAFTRRNARGVDLNRNYAYRWRAGGSAGPQPFSEPETRAVRALAMARSFHHSVSMHSGAANFGWVWNWDPAPTPDAAWLQSVAQAYADTTTTEDFWITNGADWYITYGDTNDWSYGTRGGQDYTLELTVDKAPPPELIAEYTADHLPAATRFLTEHGLAGLRGRAVDEDGEPVEVEVLVREHPWPTYADPDGGAFARALPPGAYRLVVSAPGYRDRELTATVPPSGPIEVLMQARPGLLRPAAEGAWTRGEQPRDVALTGLPAGAVDAVLFRPGLPPSDPLELLDPAGVRLDPSAVPDAWAREGEWTLLLRDGDGEVVGRLPGVLIAAAEEDAGFTPGALTVRAEGDALRVDLAGQELPAGAQLRFVGPSGERRYPLRRLLPDRPDRLSALVDPTDWPEGRWNLRVFGRGRWVVPAEELLWVGGELSAVPAEPPPGDDDDSAGDDDDSAGDDDDSAGRQDPRGPRTIDEFEGSACACSAVDAGGGLPALLLLGLPLLRRRR